MKWLTPPLDVVAYTAPQMLTRSTPQEEGASHGLYWHRRAQEGKSDLHPRRGRRARRAPGPDGAATIRRRPGRPSPGTDPPRGLDGERVGGAVPGRAGPRGHRRRPELRPDVRGAESEGEDRSARRAGPGRSGPAGSLSPRASAVGRPAACPGPLDGTGCSGADPDRLHRGHPGPAAATRLAGADGERRGLQPPGPRPAAARPPALGGGALAGRDAAGQRAARVFGRADRGGGALRRSTAGVAAT
jgi:hypothetical protein